MTKSKNPWSWLITVAVAAVIAVPAWALAEAAAGANCPGEQGGAGEHPCDCRRGGHHGGAGPRHWDPKTVTQVQGAVEEVRTMGRRGNGVHLVLAVGAEKLQVMVGPGSYLEQQGLTLAKGDVLEVKGSRVELGGGPALIAQELKKGDQVVTLRDADGTPRWAGPNAKR